MSSRQNVGKQDPTLFLPRVLAAGSQLPGEGKHYSKIVTRVVVSEFLTVAFVAYITSVVYGWGIHSNWPSSVVYIPAAGIIALMVLLVAVGFQQFAHLIVLHRHRFLWSGVGATVLAFSFFQSGLFLLKLADHYSRATFLLQFVNVALAMLCLRAIEHARLRSEINRGIVQARRAILIGASAACDRIAGRIKNSCIHVVGSFDLAIHSNEGHAHNGDGDHTALNGCKLIEYSRALRADDVILVANPDQLGAVQYLANAIAEMPVSLHVIPDGGEGLLASAQLGELGGIVTIQVLHPPLSTLNRIVKRAFDLLVASLAAIVFAPFVLAVAVAIKLDSRGPVFFWQNRHGYNNATIQVLKLRTMHVIEDSEDFTQATRDDLRKTRIGRWLRAANIDELPQLLNVLRGEMSLVGPRPHAIAHNRMFDGRITPYSRRHNVKPGITGWAQVNGCRGETDTLEKMQRRIEHDIYYIENWSFLLDLKIIALTLFSKKAYSNAH